MKRCLLLLIVFSLCACQSDRPISQRFDLEAYWSSFRQSLAQREQSLTHHDEAKDNRKKTPKWVREDRALRTWVSCVRGKGRKLGLTSNAEPEVVASSAMKGCHVQETAYAKSLKAMGIGEIGVDVRDDLGRKVSQEVAEERARNHGQLRAELDRVDAVTASPRPPPP
jgi:hypothetical protein